MKPKVQITDPLSSKICPIDSKKWDDHSDHERMQHVIEAKVASRREFDPTVMI